MSVKRIALGPWIGELGWMISAWVPAMRMYARHYADHHYVMVVPEGTQALVRDITDEIVTISPYGKPDRWLNDFKEPQPMPEVKADKWVLPSQSNCAPPKSGYYDYRRFYSGKLRNPPRVVIHARGLRRNKSAVRNWELARYVELLAALGNPPAASIGSLAGAYHVPGTVDMRSDDIAMAMYAVCNCKVCLGPSSGPMHLASVCECPHIVWTDAKYQKSIGGTNRDRYERIWNHKNTPVSVIDKYGWQPPVSAVAKVAARYL
jgi:hypothetical protein